MEEKLVLKFHYKDLYPVRSFVIKRKDLERWIGRFYTWKLSDNTVEFPYLSVS